MRYPRTKRQEKSRYTIVPPRPRIGTLNKKKKQPIFVRETLDWLQIEGESVEQQRFYLN